MIVNGLYCLEAIFCFISDLCLNFYRGLKWMTGKDGPPFPQ